MNEVKIGLILLVSVIFIAGGAGIYLSHDKDRTKFKYSDQEIDLDTKESSSQYEINGKVVYVDSNATGKSFITVQSLANSEKYAFTSDLLSQNDLGIKLGDIVKFSSHILSNKQGNYYLLTNSSELQIIGLSTNHHSLNPIKVSISDIKSNMQGQDIITEGNITELYESSKGHVFFTLNNSSNKIKCVLFNSEKNELPARLDLLKEYNNTNKNLKVLGKINIHKGDNQIVVKKVFTTIK